VLKRAAQAGQPHGGAKHDRHGCAASFDHRPAGRRVSPCRSTAFAPRLTPRPAEDTIFLQGLLEGIARIETMGYRKLDARGASPLRSVRTVGGGAVNTAWREIRRAMLGVPFLPARASDAAAGTARLALGRNALP
tara:strand:+ start:18 stop:422 length:405 start_codon:yes stop_codon:yes gene_type:complete